ncbi:MAG: hypothetical protein ABWY02_16600 [Telluria sp.]
MTFAIAFCRAAALCLLAGSAYAATVPAADASAPVPATRYQPTVYPAPSPPSATPDQAWREQNRIVAAYDSMALTMPADSGHGAHGQHAAAGADPHAGHKMPAAADPHAGHHMHTGAATGGCCKDGCKTAAAPAPAERGHGGHH